MTANKKLFPFKIGADPEFNIVFNDNRLNAKNTLKVLLDKNEKIKCNESKMGYELKNKGVIGWDGEHGTGEIRPEPANSPKRLTTNIGNLIRLITEKSTLFSILTSSINAPIGGHIHIEINDAIESKIKLIHKKLASFYLPLMLGEDCINMRIRNRSDYGLINDHRVQRLNNGAKTYEFRTPSAEWLTTPKICEATLAYVATVFNEIVNQPNNFAKSKEIIYKSEKQGEALQNLALSKYLSLSETVNNKIKKAIKTFEYYPAYKEQIDFIMNGKKVLKEKEKVEFNMIKGWEMQNIKVPTKRELMNDKKVKEIITKIDADKFGKLITKVQHNKNDQNTIMFENAIKNRILAYNWDVKKDYYIYGLRKGIDKIITFNRNFEILNPKSIIETQEDYRIIRNIFSRLCERISGPKLAKNYKKEISEEDIRRGQVFIGIPYEMRINLDTKQFLEIVYRIETNKIKLECTDENTLQPAGKGKETMLMKVYKERDIELTNEERSDVEHRNDQIADQEIRNEMSENNPEETILRSATSTWSTTVPNNF